jgi:hypothetical protein
MQEEVSATAVPETIASPSSPHKNREYFDQQETLEFKKLDENVPESLL